MYGTEPSPNVVQLTDRTMKLLGEENPLFTFATENSYRSTLHTVLTKMESYGLNTDPGQISREDFYFFLRKLTDEKLAISTRKGYAFALRSYCRINGNLSIEKVKLRWPSDYRPNTDWLSPCEAKRLISAPLDPEIALIIHLELVLGMRRIEVIRTEVGYIDFERKTILVRGKGSCDGKFRNVDFCDRPEPNMNTESVLRNYMEYRSRIVRDAMEKVPGQTEPEQLLIYAKWGKYLGTYSEFGTAIDNKLIALRECLGLKFSNHTLRRTFGRSMYYSGVELAAISAIMGHSSTIMTMKYLGLEKVSHRKEMAMLNFDYEIDAS